MKQKLELTWIGKEERPRLEPRILLEDPELSYAASERVSENDIFDNRLIFGDNLLALKALEQEFAGKVKCIFIDPPYNTGSAFTHYEDGLEHSLWLSMLRDRLEMLRRLLSEDGSIWITIDDNEVHYLKVLCDEVFGRLNFAGSVTWQHSIQGKNDAKLFSVHHNYVLVYRRSDSFKMKKLPREEEHNVNYANPDNDPKGPWRAGDVRSPNYRENLRYSVTSPSGQVIPPPDKGWRWSRATFEEKVASGEITFLNEGARVLRKIYLSNQEGRVPETIWFGEGAGTTREAMNHLTALLSDLEPFPTPKPEKLLERILQLSTESGEYVLDSFAGSGTTGAVAHKMGRRWIMVELGEHCYTHIVPRMKKVVNGTDQGGISKAVEWKGGGGFRYFRLAPSLLKQDKWGRWVINDAYNPEMLAEAICKLEGYRYSPSDTLYWQHGQSTERSFIYVTTQALNHEQLLDLSEEVGPDRTLLVSAMAFRGTREQDYPNLTLQKIPNQVLSRCEWGKDDYSLKVENLPAPAKPHPTSLFEDEEVGN